MEKEVQKPKLNFLFTDIGFRLDLAQDAATKAEIE